MSHTGEHETMLPPVSMPLWARLLGRRAAKLERGRLALIFPGGREQIFEGASAGPQAMLHLHDGWPVWRLMSEGSLGFARSYMDGQWDSPDLATLLELAIANEDRWHGMMKPLAFFAALARMRHARNNNSREGSRRNIAYHYDLGNSFYGAWLDESMTYSSALYTRPDMTLEEAQEAKYARIVDQLGLGPDDHVLEIGCGWGGFAEYAIRRTGCRVTGLTLSQEQARYARRRLAAAGLADNAEIRLEDYRDCRGKFTAIVSIEMFEAVGEENWPVYFDCLRTLLQPGGRAMVQVITIDESRFEHYRRNADFIQTWIFPGGMLPSVNSFTGSAQHAGLAVDETFRFGRDYERTLLAWDRAFISAWPRIFTAGFDERFFRMWRYYLNYCAAGFRTGRLDVVQFMLRA